MKKIIALALTATMAFSMVACGGKTDDRKIANLNEEEAFAVEVFAGAYEGMELEDIKADFAVEDLEAYKAELYLEGADKDAYVAFLDEMHGAEEMTVEDAAKYAVINRFYAGINLMNSPDATTSESEETEMVLPTEEEMAPFKELANQGKVYAKLYMALYDYMVAHPDFAENEHLDRISGVVLGFGFEMLADMFSSIDFGEAFEGAMEGVEGEFVDAIGEVVEEGIEILEEEVA